MANEVVEGGKVDPVSLLTVYKIGGAFGGADFVQVILARAKADE
ncbi:MAG: hypothetical protein AAGA43_13430 [Bacteroidota bacterium]